MIVAGWDEQQGGSVWGVPLGGTLVEQPFTIGTSFTCIQLLTLPSGTSNADNRMCTSEG